MPAAILSALELDNATAIAAAGSLVLALVTLWRLHVAALQERIAGLVAELAESRAEAARSNAAVIAALQTGAELRGRIGALEQEVQHARDSE